MTNVIKSDSLTVKQIRSACALLDWSQEDLARKMNVSVRTVIRMSAGLPVSAFTMESVRAVFEKVGVRFIKHGIRLIE